MLMRLRGINKVRAKGRVYYYHRRTGTRIRAEYGTAEFALEVARLDKAVVEPQIRAGSLGALIREYRKSPEFTGLASRTRRDYQRIFDYVAPLDGLPLVQIDSAFVLKLRDKAFRHHKRRFANYVLQVLSIVFAWGKPRKLTPSNPAADVEHIRRPRDAREINRAWRDEEVSTWMAEAPIELRVAVALGLYAALREGDAIAISWTAYNGLEFESRHGKTGKPIWIAAHRELRSILDEWKAWRRHALECQNERRARRGLPPLPDCTNILVGSKLRPYTQNGFQSRFFKFVRKLTAAGKVHSGLTFHGLRHSAGKNLADAGCDNRDIMAVLGHKTEKMAAHYTREADQRKRGKSAVLKWERARRRKPQ
jgi:integrase